MIGADKSTRRAFLILLGCCLGLALLPVFFPALDIAVSRYFLRPDATLKTADWWWVYVLNEYVPMVFRSWFVLCMVAWWLTGRNQKYHHLARPVAFVGLALLAGPGMMVSSIKDITTRARPHHVSQFEGTRTFTPALKIANQCDDNCAFPSGHTSDGIFIATLMLIDRRRRWWWLTGGVVGGLTIGFARVSVGAHWLSDALWAFPVTLLGSWLVLLLFDRFYPEPKTVEGAPSKA